MQIDISIDQDIQDKVAQQNNFSKSVFIWFYILYTKADGDQESGKM